MVDVGRKRDEIVEKVSLRKMSETVRGVFGNMWKEREREREEKKRKREGKEKKREKSVGGIKITWACCSCSCSCCCCYCFSRVQIPLSLSLSLSHDFLLLLHLHLHLRYQLSQPTTTTTIFLIPLPCRAGHGWRQGILRRFHTKIHFLILNKRLICLSGKKNVGFFPLFSRLPNAVLGFSFFCIFGWSRSLSWGGDFGEREIIFVFFWVFDLVWSEIGARVFDVWIFVLLLLISEKAPISL